MVVLVAYCHLVSVPSLMVLPGTFDVICETPIRSLCHWDYVTTFCCVLGWEMLGLCHLHCWTGVVRGPECSFVTI
jgi:hypothetical protein